MPADRIPLIHNLSDIYTADALSKEQKRWGGLVQAFEMSYGEKPAWISRAPGRVNIIGDHVDYCGLGCLPAAIQRDVLFAGRLGASSASTSRIRLRSTQPDKYKDEVIDIGANGNVELDKTQHSYGNYVRAALSGVLEGHKADVKPFELDLLCDGNVPAGGGLSSSAAMVIASSLACLQALGELERVSRTAMTEIAIVSERLVGVNSGGMDQTASVFGERSSLLHIEFVPKLRSRSVTIPSFVAFVIANSLVTSEKHLTAKRHYNLRVVEMRAVTAVLARRLNITDVPSPPTIKALVDALPCDHALDDEAARLQELLEVVERELAGQRKVTPWWQVLEQLGLDSQEAFEREVQQGIEIEAPDGLKLYKRARHILTESLRVHKACRLLDAPTDSPDLAKDLGQLMKDSQDSLRDFCESSGPECDDLVDSALEAGALGSRVTGAGWGGCTVHLVRAGEEERLIRHLRQSYYSERFPDLTEDELDAACFATRPERGACLYMAA